MRHLLRGDRADAWTPMVAPLCYFALVHEFGRTRIERTLAKLS